MKIRQQISLRALVGTGEPAIMEIAPNKDTYGVKTSALPLIPAVVETRQRWLEQLSSID